MGKYYDPTTGTIQDDGSGSTVTPGPNPTGNPSFGGQISPSSGPADGPGSSTFGGGSANGSGSNGYNFGNLLSGLGSPGGQAATGLAGAGLSSLGSYLQSQQQLKQQALMQQAALAQGQYQSDQSNQIQRATGTLNADPLGADQSFAQRNALASAILPNLRNARTTPGDPAVAAAMGTRTGGIMNALPANGLDPAMIQSMFGPQATMQSIAQRHQEINSLNPNAPTPDLNPMFGAQSAGPMAQMQQWAQAAQNSQGAQRAAYESKMQNFLSQMVGQQGQGSSFWTNFAKIAGVLGVTGAVNAITGGKVTGALGQLGGALGSAIMGGKGGNGSGGSFSFDTKNGVAGMLKNLFTHGANNGQPDLTGLGPNGAFVGPVQDYGPPTPWGNDPNFGSNPFDNSGLPGQINPPQAPFDNSGLPGQIDPQQAYQDWLLQQYQNNAPTDSSGGGGYEGGDF